MATVRYIWFDIGQLRPQKPKGHWTQRLTDGAFRHGAANGAHPSTWCSSGQGSWTYHEGGPPVLKAVRAHLWQTRGLPSAYLPACLPACLAGLCPSAGRVVGR